MKPDAKKTQQPLHGVTTTSHFITFRVADGLYAFELKCVQRVLRMVATARLPEAPSWILGAVNMHGEVIPVLDLAQRFGAPATEPTPDHRLLVVWAKPLNLAYMVDEVLDLIQIEPGQLEKPSGPLEESLPLAGVLRGPTGLVLVLDSGKLAPPEAKWAIGLNEPSQPSITP